MLDPWQLPLWDAVSNVVAACGGNVSNTSVARQKAVVEVNNVVREAIFQAVEQERRAIAEAIVARAKELKRSTIAGAAVAEIAGKVARKEMG